MYEEAVVNATEKPEMAHLLVSARIAKEVNMHEDNFMFALAPYMHANRYTLSDIPPPPPGRTLYACEQVHTLRQQLCQAAAVTSSFNIKLQHSVGFDSLHFGVHIPAASIKSACK